MAPLLRAAAREHRGRSCLPLFCGPTPLPDRSRPVPGQRGTLFWVRAPAVIALAVAALAGVVATAAPARSPASAGARAAVVSGTLGTVARVSATGDDGTSRSAPSDTPDGIELGGGSVSVFSAKTGDASAQAEAQASGVVLLDGAVTADSVRRTATDTGSGVRYGGAVSGLKIDGKKVTPRAGRQYPLPNGAGYVVASAPA